MKTLACIALYLLFTTGTPISLSAQIEFSQLVEMINQPVKSKAVKKVMRLVKRYWGKPYAVKGMGTPYYLCGKMVIYLDSDGDTVISVELYESYPFQVPDSLIWPLSREAIESATGDPFGQILQMYYPDFTLTYRDERGYYLRISAPKPNWKALNALRHEPDSVTFIPRITASELFTCNQGDCQNGFAELYNPFVIYRGQMKDGKAEGKGYLVMGEDMDDKLNDDHPNGQLVYEGNFKNGYAHDLEATVQYTLGGVQKISYVGGVHLGNFKGYFETAFPGNRVVKGVYYTDSYKDNGHFTMKVYSDSTKFYRIGEISGFFDKYTWVMNGSFTIKQKGYDDEWSESNGEFIDNMPHGEHTSTYMDKTITGVYEMGELVSGVDIYKGMFTDN